MPLLGDALTEAFVIVCVAVVVTILCACSVAFLAWCFFEAVHRYFEWSDPMPGEVPMTDDEEEQFMREIVLESMRRTGGTTVLSHGVQHPSDGRDMESVDV